MQNVVQTKFKAAVLQKYKNICMVCNEPLNNGEFIEFHHIIPIRKGGDYALKNMMPLHQICHQKVTYTTRGDKG